MTRELLFLFIGYGVVWIALFAYLVYVTGRIQSVGDEIKDLRHQLEPEEPRAPESGD